MTDEDLRRDILDELDSEPSLATGGFGLSWLIFGQHWHRADYVARRMSHSSERFE